MLIPPTFPPADKEGVLPPPLTGVAGATGGVEPGTGSTGSNSELNSFGEATLKKMEAREVRVHTITRQQYLNQGNVMTQMKHLVQYNGRS